MGLNSQCRASRRIMQPFIKTAVERVPSQLGNRAGVHRRGDVCAAP